MRGKKAKRLRRQAEAMTVGHPKIEYDYGQPPQYEKKISFDGITTSIFKTALGIPRTLKKCTRLAYKILKRARS